MERDSRGFGVAHDHVYIPKYWGKRASFLMIKVTRLAVVDLVEDIFLGAAQSNTSGDDGDKGEDFVGHFCCAPLSLVLVKG